MRITLEGTGQEIEFQALAVALGCKQIREAEEKPEKQPAAKPRPGQAEDPIEMRFRIVKGAGEVIAALPDYELAYSRAVDWMDEHVGEPDAPSIERREADGSWREVWPNGRDGG